MYEPRLYRNRMNLQRFRGFRVVVGESDLWVGVSPESYDPEMAPSIEAFMRGLRDDLQNYILSFPVFRDTFDPLPVLENDPDIVVKMKNAAIIAGTGPMAAVAGMVAQETGLFLSGKFHPGEYVIENGGDIYAAVKDPVILAIDAGGNKKFSDIGLLLTPDMSPSGICTSSGMFGHSVSLGKADSVTVVCPSACDADALATGVANQIQSSADIRGVVERTFNGNMYSLVCIKDEQIGIRGRIQIARL